jgi:short subunit fatty acids transporter
MTVTVFVNQLIFIWARTWNVKAISKIDIKGTLLSGAVVHIAWLLGITIGAVSVKEILIDFQFQYIPVVVASLSGGLLGSYLGLIEKKQKS